MEFVFGKHAGQSQVVGRMSGDAGAFPECVGNTLITPDRTTIQVRISWQGRVGIGRSSWKGLTRDATRRLRFVVHAAGWLHSMVLHGRIRSRRRIHMLSICASTAIDAHSNDTMAFYDSLSSIVDAILTRDHVFLCGDFNLTLPVDEVRVRNRCGEANHNTKMFLSFVERHDLLAANAYTRQQYRSLPTFDVPNRRKTRLDWIFCTHRYRFNLQKSNTLNTSVITSDDRFFTASYSLK